MFPAPEGLQTEIRQVFALPIPKAVWKKMKSLQDRDYVRFVDECLRNGT
jgi:hypothetical protein